jgi:hypothetical protein
MLIDIKTTNDELFHINTVKFGERYLASDGERSAIGTTKELAVEEVQEMQTQNEVDSNAAPLENSREGHPFDPFGGTSWAGKRNDFN